jgi:hypothetical protein
VCFQEDIVPLTSCFHLQVLNVADNHIIALHNTVDILAQLRRLEVLSLHVSAIYITIKAAHLQINAYFHENFKNEFKCILLYDNLKE